MIRKILAGDGDEVLNVYPIPELVAYWIGSGVECLESRHRIRNWNRKTGGAAPPHAPTSQSSDKYVFSPLYYDVISCTVVDI